MMLVQCGRLKPLTMTRSGASGGGLGREVNPRRESEMGEKLAWEGRLTAVQPDNPMEMFPIEYLQV